MRWLAQVWAAPGAFSIAASRARTCAARATRPPLLPQRLAVLRRAARGLAAPGVSRSQRAELVRALLARRNRRFLHGGRPVGAGRPRCGPLPARRDRSEPSTYTCRSCDAIATAATESGCSAPGAPCVGRTPRVAIAAGRARTRVAHAMRPALPPRRTQSPRPRAGSGRACGRNATHPRHPDLPPGPCGERGWPRTCLSRVSSS